MSASPGPNAAAAGSDHLQARRDEEVIDSEKDVLAHDAHAVNSGIPYPTATAPNIGVPTVSTSVGRVSSAPEEKISRSSIAASSDTLRNPPLEKSTSNAVSKSHTHKKSKFNFLKSRKKKEEEERKNKEKEKEASVLPPVSFFALFRFAAPLEIVAMVLGLVLAVAAGCCQPLMTLIFGKNQASLARSVVADVINLQVD